MKFIAQLFSYLFHPLLALTYILLLIILINPFLFGSYSLGGNIEIIAMIFFSTFLFPAFAVFLLYKLDFLKDIKMPYHKDRIIPLMIAMVCYFSVFAFIYQSEEVPDEFKIAVLGACVNMALAFLITIFYKISLHSIGMGAMLAITIYLSFLYKNIQVIINVGPLGSYSVPVLVLLFIVILITGIVMTSRLYLKAHEPGEVYRGLLLGVLVQAAVISFF